MITTAHWNAFAKQCDVKPRFLNDLVDETAARLLENITRVKAVFETRFGAYPALQRVAQVVIKQCQHLGNP